MYRSKSSRSDHAAARAFERVGWDELRKRLYEYATGTLHLAAIDAKKKGRVEATDAVNTLAERALDGSLPWTLPEDAPPKEIIRQACMKLRSGCSARYRHDARSVGGGRLPQRLQELLPITDDP